jgi:hypothetical protein
MLFSSGEETVNLTMVVKDSLEKVSKFAFAASPSQAAAYRCLNAIKILPVESSGFALILDVVDFILLPLDSSLCEKKLNEKRLKSEDFDLSMEQYFRNQVSEFAPRFRESAVSIDSSAFDKSSNVANEEVKKVVAWIRRLQEQKFGAVNIIAPSLGSENILPIYDCFDGEIKSYLSNHRNIHRLLLDNYPVFTDPLVNPCRLETLRDIDKKNFYIPPRHASFECAIGDGSDGERFKLETLNPHEKVNLFDHSLEKGNKTRHVDVKRIVLKVNGEDVTSDSCTNFNIANESAVGALVNAETAKYSPGNVEVRDLGTEYDIGIPVKVHADFTTAKSPSGYVCHNL